MTWGDGVAVIGVLYLALVAAVLLAAGWEALQDAADRRIDAEFAAAGVPRGADDVMDLADAFGVNAASDQRGAQPACEFSSGPVLNGPLWSDTALHAELERLERGEGR